MAKSKGGTNIIIGIAVLIFLILIGLVLYFFLHVPIEALVIGFIVLIILATIILLVLILMGKRTAPDLYKKNYEKVTDACMVSIPHYMFDKDVYLESGAYLGKLKGFAHITDISTDENEKQLSRKEYVLHVQRKPNFIQKLLPFLTQFVTIRLEPKWVMDLTTPDLIIKTNTVKRLDNFFYTPIQSSEAEFKQLKAINSELYREYSIFTLDKVAEMSEKSMKANPSFIQRKDQREGGLGTRIERTLGED